MKFNFVTFFCSFYLNDLSYYTLPISTFHPFLDYQSMLHMPHPVHSLQLGLAFYFASLYLFPEPHILCGIFLVWWRNCWIFSVFTARKWCSQNTFPSFWAPATICPIFHSLRWDCLSDTSWACVVPFLVFLSGLYKLWQGRTLGTALCIVPTGSSVY